ncbi:hypothetical protein evm_005298 [Chilo suppressalis]|nr:hypothetical protein evm_005298 [Chilo suppressalis]
MVNKEIPISWKTQELIPLLKHNKPPADPNSYRPIALASVLSKIAEHLVKNRLEWFLESKALLASSQYGFRKGKSTMDSIGIFTTDIRLAFSNNHSLLAPFIDISGAYDNVDIQILKNKLEVPLFLIDFIINLLSERLIKIDMGDGHFKSRLTCRGLPQGSILSPLLYNVYTYDLESYIAGRANILQYADDLVFYVSGSSIIELSQSVSNVLTLLKSCILDYGTCFLEPCSALALSKLDGIQSKALRIVTGVMKSSPINAFQVECVEPPLKLRRQFLCDKFLFRALQLSDHPLFKKLHYLLRKINNSAYWNNKSLPCLVISYIKFTSLLAPTHRSQYLPISSINYEALTISPKVIYLDSLRNDKNANINLMSIVNTEWPDWHYIYCDVSKHPSTGIVGIGVYHQQYKITQKIKLPPETSVYTGECYEILKSLEYILLAQLKKTIIFSDSKSTLQAIEKFPFKASSSNAYLIDCRKLLLNCTLKNLNVLFAWIPDHHNITGNEVADKLAKESVNCGDVFPYKNLVNDLLLLPKVHLRISWEENWVTSSRVKGKHYKLIQQSIPDKPWFSKIHLIPLSAALSYTAKFSHYADGRPVSETLDNTAKTVLFLDQLFDRINGASMLGKKSKGKCSSNGGHK